MKKAAAFLEHSKRSLAKTITYRILIILSTLAISYALTRDVKIMAAFTAISSISSTILYFVHERVWNGIGWGKVKRT